jgi:uncharacterized protein
MRRSVAVICAAIWLAAAAPAFAQSAAERGWNAYLAGRHGEAWRALKPLADQGDANAQYYVGSLYQVGHGVPASAHHAATWYEKAAQQNHALAQFALGFLLYYGGGEGDDALQANPAAAAPWIDKAAQQQIVPAQHLLARMYSEGRGVPADRQQALDWTLRAAEVGFVPAQFDAGVLLAEQPGLDKALEAYKWFELAARSHYPAAAQNRDRLIDRLNSQELHQAKAMADAWNPRQ